MKPALKSKIVDIRGNPFDSSSYTSPYEGAARGRRTAHWPVNSAGPNQTLTSAQRDLRDRARALYRNNPWIASGIDNLVSNEIGTGMMPEPMFDRRVGLRKKLKAIWADWIEESDIEGVMPLHGQIAQADLARFVAGECFGKFVMLGGRKADDSVVPLRLRILESEFCDIHWTYMGGHGNQIRNGIEFARDGSRVKYWMYPEHPNEDIFRSANIRQPVPAEDIIHHYKPTRPGQIRGESTLTQAIIRAFDIDQYEHAELTRKKTRAAQTGVFSRSPLTTDDGLDPLTGQTIDQSAVGPEPVDIQPGTITEIDPGASVTMFDADDPGTGMDGYMRWLMLGIYAGMHVPYEFGTGDFSKVNDRLVRVILAQYQRYITQSQQHIVIPQMYKRIWARFLDTAVLSGRVEIAGYFQRRREFQRVEFRHQGWPYVHPLQDAQAIQAFLSMGLTSRTDEGAKLGMNVEDIDRKNREDIDRAARLDLEYATDPAQRTTATQPAGTSRQAAQKTNTAIDPEEPDDEDETG